MDTEEELNFVRQAKRFFFASYHSSNLIGGSTNEYVQSETGLEPIAYADYIRNQSGEITDNVVKDLHQFEKNSHPYGSKFNFTGCLAGLYIVLIIPFRSSMQIFKSFLLSYLLKEVIMFR